MFCALTMGMLAGAANAFGSSSVVPYGMTPAVSRTTELARFDQLQLSNEMERRRIFMDQIRDVLEFRECTNTDAYEHAANFLTTTVDRIRGVSPNDNCNQMKELILPQLRTCVMETTGLTHTVYAGVTGDFGFGLNAAYVYGAYVDSDGAEGCFKTTCVGIGANIHIGIGGVAGLLLGDGVNDFPGVAYGGEVGGDLGPGYDLAGGATSGGKIYAEISAGLGLGFMFGFSTCTTETYGRSEEPTQDYVLVPGASCPAGYRPLTSSWWHCKAAAKSLGHSGDSVAHVDYHADAVYGAWDTSRPKGCFQSTGNGRFHFNIGSGAAFTGEDKILCVANHEDYNLKAGSTCEDGYEPITSSWQDCEAAAKTLGYRGDSVAHVDYGLNWGFGRPRGCFQSDGSGRFHFNRGLGGRHIGDDKILCKRAGCPTVSKNGRCGPSFGNAVCSTQYRPHAVYCNEDNGWCGDSEAHRTAQESTRFDESRLAMASQCDGAKFDIGNCDHLELTEGGNCVATKVYGNNHDCEITVLGDFDLEVRDWEVETHWDCRYDYLKLPSGDKFCTDSPQGESVSTGDKLEWSTDYSVTKEGWEICAGSRRRQGRQRAASDVEELKAPVLEEF